MTTIEEFIEARLLDDERIARAAFLTGTPATAQWTADAPEVRSVDGSLVVKHTWPKEAEHIAHQDPARVLIDVDVARRILALHERIPASDGVPMDWCSPCDGDGYVTGPGWPCQTVRLLASKYRSHPDYDTAWEPRDE